MPQLLEETDFTDPFPAGLLQAVDALVWKAVKPDPVVIVPESAAAEPALMVGDVPVFVVVTASKFQLESTTLAASAERMNGIHCLGSINAPNRIEKIVKNAKNLRFKK